MSLDNLPFYLRGLKELFHHQRFSHQNYRKYMLLTAREREILNLIAEGFSNRQISESLFISLHTMATHRKNILKKTGLPQCTRSYQIQYFFELLRDSTTLNS